MGLSFGDKTSINLGVSHSRQRRRRVLSQKNIKFLKSLGFKVKI